MSIVLNIKTTGVNTLERAAKAFRDNAKALKENDQAAKNLSSSDKNLIAYFKSVAKASGQSAESLAKVVRTVKEVEKTLTSAQKLSRPFTELDSSIKKTTKSVVELGHQLRAAAAATALKFDNAKFVDQVQSAKAGLLVQQEFNREIEKQVALKAKLAMADPTSVTGKSTASKGLKEWAVLAEKAKLETARLNNEWERSQAIAGKGDAQAGYARQTMKGVEAAQRLVKAQVMGKEQSKLLENQMRKEAAAMKMAADARAGYAQQAMTGVESAQKLINAQHMGRRESKLLEEQMRKEAAAMKMAADARARYAQQAMTGAAAAQKITGFSGAGSGFSADLKRQMEAQNVVIQKQIAGVDRLKQRLMALQGTKMPVAEARRLKEEIRALNIELLKTGKSQSGGIAGISTQLRRLEGRFAGTKSSIASVNDETSKWGKNSKYVMGGIARSLGAMTYSYTALAPLIAGIAAGSAIKQVYSLGDAFEYTTTYVDALDDSLKSIDAGKIQSQILDADTLRKGPQEIAEGLKEFAKAGESASSSLKQITELSKFATLAEIGLADAVKLVVGQSRAFGTSYAETANIIASAALASATSIQELGTAMSYTTELATVADVKLNEVATAMAIMANAGIRGSKAGTAIRSSIIRMLNPTEKLKNMLDEANISWEAFTEDGRIKDVRTMFMELKKATDQLPNEKRVAVLRELFGLRALRGGANLLRSMAGDGREWDEMIKKTEEANESLSFLSKKYAEVADTVTAKREKLRSEFQKSLIGAFESEQVKDMLDTLRATVASQGFKDGVKAIVEGLNAISVAAVGFVQKMGEVKGDFVDHGLITAMLFGPTPASKIAAGLALITKNLKEFIDARRSAEMEKFTKGAFIALPDPTMVTEETMDVSRLEDYKKKLMEIQKEQLLIKFPKPMLRSAEGWLEPYIQQIKDGTLEIEVEGKNLQKEIERIQRIIKGKTVKVSKSDVLKNLESSIEEAIKSGDKEYELQLRLTLNEKRLKEAIDGGLGSVISDIKKKGIRLEQELGSLVEKSDKKMLEMALGAQKYKEITEMRNLDEKAKNNFEEEFRKIDLAKKLSGMKEWDRAMEEARQKAIEVGRAQSKTLDENHTAVQKLIKENQDLIKVQGLDKVTTATKQLDFYTNEVKALEASTSAVDQLKAAYANLNVEAYKFTEYKGVDFSSDEGKEYFRALVENSRIFEDAIEDATDKVRKLQEELADTKFDLGSDIFSERQKLQEALNRKRAPGDRVDTTMETYKYQLRQIAQLKKAAEEAGNAGVKGRERQVELLKKAYSIAQGLNTSRDADFLESKMKSAYATMKKYENASNSMKYRSQSEYIKAKQAFEAAKNGDVDVDLQRQKIKEMEALGRAITDSLKKSEADAQKELEGVKGFAEDAKKAWLSSEEASKAALEQAKEYGKTMTKNGETMEDWSARVGNLVDGVTNKLELLNMQGKIANEIFKDSDYEFSLPDGGTKGVEGARDLAEAAKEAWAGSEQYLQVSIEGAEAFGKELSANGEVVDENAEAMRTWSTRAEAQMEGVTSKLEKLNAEARKTAEIFKNSNYEFNVPEGRAVGGPVSNNQTYMVGEKGPELFTPGASGYITPNHELTRSSSKSGTVDLNLNIGGKVIPMGQTPKHSVDDLIRQFEDLDKYSSGG